MTTALSLPALRLSEDEAATAGLLRGQLLKVYAHNKAKSDLYEGKHTAHDLGIAAPQGLPEIVHAVIGWPGTVVDVLEERLEFRGWSGADDLGLADVVRDNHLDVESGRGHLDSLIYGCGFVAIGNGDTAAGEPELLVSIESTESCTVDWDYRLRRAKSALSQTRDEHGAVVRESLYLPNETVVIERDSRGRYAVLDRSVHGIGRVPVARLLNRERASDLRGRSEITKAVTYLTDAAIRTAVGMEVNREFYTSPKWTALNADPAVFGMGEDADDNANRAAGWSATAGRLNAIPPQQNDDGEPVEVRLHEFRPAPPTPYIEQLRAYSQLLAAESGIPAPYLGFVTDNPSSADSIRQQEYRLVKRAERRQMSFGLGWLEVAMLVLLLRDGAIDQSAFRQVSTSWRDASTPTRAAAADEAAKLIGAGVLPADSPVTMDRIGLTPQEQEQLARDRRRSSVSTLLQQVRDSGAVGISG